MTHTPELRDFVAAWESLRTTAYRDAVGVWTVGYGRTTNVHEGDTCTPEEAEEWLDEELTEFGEGLDVFFTREPDQQQFDALLSLAYNCGVDAIGNSGLMARFNDGQDAEVLKRFPLWSRAGGRTLNGLVKRRNAEAAIYRDGDYSGRP